MARLTRRNVLASSLVSFAPGIAKSTHAAAQGNGKRAKVSASKNNKKVEEEKPKNNKTVEKENKFLVVPQNPISGGDAVPIGIKLTSAWLRKVNANLTVKAELRWNDALVAVFTVGKRALGNRDQDVKFATRIKIPSSTPKGELTVVIIPDGRNELRADDAVELVITKCGDCSAVNHGQLVLATQPAPFSKDKAVAVKSYVPVSMPASRVLKRIDCLFARPSTEQLPPPDSLPDYELIRADVTTMSLLSDEVFLAIDFLASENGLLEMLWTYDDASTNLQACAYLAQAG